VEAIITILVFAAVSALVFAVLELIFSEERRVTRVLRTVSSWEAQQAAEAEPMLRSFKSRVISPVARGVGNRLRQVLPVDLEGKRLVLLRQAGSPASMTPESVMALQIGAAIAIPLLVIIAMALLRVGVSVTSMLVVACSAVAGYEAPTWWLAHAARARKNRMRRALPDMMDMLTISVQAGLGFDMALVKLVRSTTGPLAEEFGRMLNEVQAGVSRREALRHMGERTDIPELDAFITAMVQADVFGVSVSGILQAQSLELRKKRRQFVEEQAQKAPVRMVFPIIFCMLPATLLVVLGPAVIAIGRTFGITR